jgi:diadenosine tetraphosphate (Ap4A) HIT family hydrolase
MNTCPGRGSPRQLGQRARPSEREKSVAAVARALDHVYQPAKMNYGVFGNLNLHIHRHLVPQFFSDEPTLPLNMQATDVRLVDQDYLRIVHALRQALGRRG